MLHLLQLQQKKVIYTVTLLIFQISFRIYQDNNFSLLLYSKLSLSIDEKITLIHFEFIGYDTLN